MKFKNSLFINARKLKERKGKALFLIIPITVIMLLSIVISSQAYNFKEATDESIFGSVEKQAELIEIKKEAENQQGMKGGFNPQDREFSETDAISMESIENIETATINSNLPISNISSSDLFEDTKIDFNNIVGLDSNTASLYTQENFEYNENQVVPIIINANSFEYEYEDWEDKNEFVIDFNELRNKREEGQDMKKTMESQTPVRRKALSYTKNDLIGKEFILNVGGFDDISTYETEQDGMVITMTKLTESELEEKENSRNSTISEYWDYEKLKTPLQYNVKVVGIIEDETQKSTFVPTEFANLMMQDYVQNQLDALTSEIDSDLLNTTFNGITYDGIELTSNQTNMSAPGGMDKMRNPMNNNDDEEETESYNIPGLVIKLSEDGQETVEGIYTETDVYKDAIKYGETISLKINTVYNRTQVVEDLNEMGYAYQDINNLEVFSNLQTTLDNLTLWMTIAFIALTVAIVIMAMSKFVSDSRKEIGIFRAVGITKNGIISIFVSQALLYSFVGFLTGSLLGIITNFAISGFVKTWFDDLVSNTIRESFNVVNEIDSSLFTNIDWASFGIYTAALFILALIISLIPAIKASNVSPVEAIKSE